MNPITKWRKQRQEKKLDAQLAEIWTKADKLRAGGEPYRPIEDFMTKPVEIQYAILALQHEAVCRELGTHSKFFSPKMHPWASEPNSPVGTLTVRDNNSDKIEEFQVEVPSSDGKSTTNCWIVLRNGKWTPDRRMTEKQQAAVEVALDNRHANR